VLLQSIPPPELSAALACPLIGFWLGLWAGSWTESWAAPGYVAPAYCHLKTYQEDDAIERFAAVSKESGFVAGMKRGNSTSQDARTGESFAGVGLYIGSSAGDVEPGLRGRYSAAPYLTLGHIVDFDNMRLRSALEARPFPERAKFAAYAAYSFPARRRPTGCVNMHS
jgi:hypothetical protein